MPILKLYNRSLIIQTKLFVGPGHLNLPLNIAYVLRNCMEEVKNFNFEGPGRNQFPAKYSFSLNGGKENSTLKFLWF